MSIELFIGGVLILLGFVCGWTARGLDIKEIKRNNLND